ncbi:MAG: hypothetical protein ACR2LE_07655 [Nocardioidaceae bacterium]
MTAPKLCPQATGVTLTLLVRSFDYEAVQRLIDPPATWPAAAWLLSRANRTSLNV